MTAYAAGFSPGPSEGGRCERCAHFMAFLSPRPPLPLCAFSIKSQGSTRDEFAGSENICIVPKAEQAVEQQNFKQWDFDQHVWKPAVTETALSSRRQETRPAFPLATEFIQVLGKRLCLSCDSVSPPVKERLLTSAGHWAISRRREHAPSRALPWDPAIPRRKRFLLLLCSCKVTEKPE